MTRNLECGLRYLDGALLALYSLKELCTVNVIVLAPWFHRPTWERRYHLLRFQHDGAAAHTANNSMKLMNEIFGERVISRNVWPPRSPDVTPPEFYVWGAAKSAVYCNRPKTAITAYIRNVSQTDLQKMFANKIKRVQAYIDARGHHFQHLF
jgi:hypothetical protein